LAPIAVRDESPDIPRAAPLLVIVMSPLAPELMRMVAAGLEGKTLATPDPPLVIVIGPGLDPSTSGLVDSVSIVRRPPDAASGGASIASPGVAITVLPTTVTGLFAGENTSTVVVIGDPGKTVDRRIFTASR
jgi:hypothetical protein